MNKINKNVCQMDISGNSGQCAEKEIAMESAGEVWTYPQAKATSNAALAARVVELERELAARPGAQQGAESRFEPIGVIQEGRFRNRFEWVSDEVADDVSLIGASVYFVPPAQPDSQRDAALLDLRDFKESQWWLKELDGAVAHGTDDQKRAVAVVRHMLRVAAIVTQQGGQP